MYCVLRPDISYIGYRPSMEAGQNVLFSLLSVQHQVAKGVFPVELLSKLGSIRKFQVHPYQVKSGRVGKFAELTRVLDEKIYRTFALSECRVLPQ